MILASVLVLFLAIGSIRIKCPLFNRELYEESYSIESTNAMKGILAIGIVLSHLVSKVDHQLPFITFSAVGSIGVAVFFLFSGYALAWCTKNKSDYLEYFISRRFIKIFLPYIIYLLLYTVIVCIFCDDTLLGIIQSFTNGFPVSNTWYIIAIMLFYVLFYFCFRRKNLVNSKSISVGIIQLSVLTIVYIAITWLFWPDWWYKTCELFVIGVALGFYRPQIESRIQKHYSIWLVCSVLFFMVSYSFPAIISHVWPNNLLNVWLINDALMGLSFALMIALLMFKGHVNNRITRFLGSISFELYLCHGLVIKLLFDVYGNDGNQWWQEISSICTLILSILLAWILHFVFKRTIKYCNRLFSYMYA